MRDKVTRLSADHNFQRETTAEAELYRGPSVYQPNAFTARPNLLTWVTDNYGVFFPFLSRTWRTEEWVEWVIIRDTHDLFSNLICSLQTSSSKTCQNGTIFKEIPFIKQHRAKICTCIFLFKSKIGICFRNMTNKHMMISSLAQKLESAFVWRGAYQRGFHSGLRHGLFFL